MQRSFGPDEFPDLPSLPGLHDGFTKIRQDEGRHVGFGMTKLKELVSAGAVNPQLLDATVTELMPLVEEIAADDRQQYAGRGMSPEELRRFAGEKHVERMQQIRDASAELPAVETLTEIR
jgi:ribonucleoside-diphosphate reductase beta chain